MSCQTRPRSFPERRRVTAVGKHVAQLEQGRVGGEDVEHPVGASRHRAVEAALERRDHLEPPLADTRVLQSQRQLLGDASPSRPPVRRAARASRSRRPRSRRCRARPRCGRSGPSTRRAHPRRPRPRACGTPRSRRRGSSPAGSPPRGRRGRSAPPGRTRRSKIPGPASPGPARPRSEDSRRQPRWRCRRCRALGVCNLPRSHPRETVRVKAAPAIPLSCTRRAATDGSGRALPQLGHSYTPRWPRYAAEYVYAVPQRAAVLRI